MFFTIGEGLFLVLRVRKTISFLLSLKKKMTDTFVRMFCDWARGVLQRLFDPELHAEIWNTVGPI
jgi:hypothetical protein